MKLRDAPHAADLQPIASHAPGPGQTRRLGRAHPPELAVYKWTPWPSLTHTLTHSTLPTLPLLNCCKRSPERRDRRTPKPTAAVKKRSSSPAIPSGYAAIPQRRQSKRKPTVPSARGEVAPTADGHRRSSAIHGREEREKYLIGGPRLSVGERRERRSHVANSTGP